MAKIKAFFSCNRPNHHANKIGKKILKEIVEFTEIWTYCFKNIEKSRKCSLKWLNSYKKSTPLKKVVHWNGRATDVWKRLFSKMRWKYSRKIPEIFSKKKYVANAKLISKENINFNNLMIKQNKINEKKHSWISMWLRIENRMKMQNMPAQREMDANTSFERCVHSAIK